MDHPFTGTFASGSDTAVIRFSETTLLNDASKGLLPSVAVKFLIDGRSSNNVFGMPSFKSSDSWDFFSQPMKSQVDPFTEDMTVEMETIFVKLLEGSVQPFGTGTAHVADQNNDGTEVTDVKTPFMLEFESSIHFPDTKQDDQMWYD